MGNSQCMCCHLIDEDSSFTYKISDDQGEIIFRWCLPPFCYLGICTSNRIGWCLSCSNLHFKTKSLIRNFQTVRFDDIEELTTCFTILHQLIGNNNFYPSLLSDICNIVQRLDVFLQKSNNLNAVDGVLYMCCKFVL